MENEVTLLTGAELERVKSYIAEGRVIDFYKWAQWLHLRAEVLAELHGECQGCKARGMYHPAWVVHHVLHLRDHPELALSKYYRDPYTGELRRQLVPLCKECHWEAHPEEYRPKTQRHSEPLLTAEWW